MYRSTVFIAVIPLLLSACQSSSQHHSDTQSESEFSGIWTSIAYGETIAVRDHSVSLYQHSSDYCISAGDQDVSDQALIRDGWQIFDSAGETHLRQFQTLLGTQTFSPEYTLQSSLPESCQHNLLNAHDINALDLFDFFVQTYAELYPSFTQRKVNWDAHAADVRQTLTTNSDGDELIPALAELIEPLQDSHLSINIGDDSISFSRNNTLLLQLISEFIDSEGEVTNEQQYQALLTYLDEQITRVKNNRLNYAAGDIESRGNNLVQWYLSDNNTGVLIIDGMLGFDSPAANTSTNTNTNTNNEERSEIADLQTIAAIMDEAITALQDSNGLVIDIRLNGGGYDSVSQLISRYFLDSSRSLYQKQARLGSGRTEPDTITLQPASRTYLKPITLLTSANTVSAAEVFTLIMRELPQVTLMGSETQGALADVLDRTLTDDISFTLVNEYYLTMDGDWFEGSGIPAEIATQSFTLAQRNDHRDDTLAAALDSLSDN